MDQGAVAVSSAEAACEGKGTNRRCAFIGARQLALRVCEGTRCMVSPGNSEPAPTLERGTDYLTGVVRRKKLELQIRWSFFSGDYAGQPTG